MLSQTLIRENRIEALVSIRASVANATGVAVSPDLSVMETLFIFTFAFCVGSVRLEGVLGHKKDHMVVVCCLIS